jgi:hypothetical protein
MYDLSWGTYRTVGKITPTVTGVKGFGSLKLSASLECGGLAPLCYRSRPLKDQSGARPPHSKEYVDVTQVRMYKFLPDGR